MTIEIPPTIRVAPIGPEHIPAIQELASDPALALTTNLPDPYPPDGAQRFVAKVTQTAAEGTEVVYAILADDELVGVCGFLEIGGTPKQAELGYWIGRPYWGRGYAKEGVRLALQRGITDLQLDRIIACHITSNPASGRVLERNGFHLTHEGPATRGEKWSADDVFTHYELLTSE
jgi:RimJ/RimL family protein N-acetyltransferase